MIEMALLNELILIKPVHEKSMIFISTDIF